MSENIDKNGFLSVIKGCFVSIIITLLLLFVFAFIIKISSLSDAVIKPVNQFIKVVSLFCGCITFIKGERGYLKGLCLGLLYTILAYLIFSIISFEKVFSVKIVFDLLFCGVVGCISGILGVNLSKKN